MTNDLDPRSNQDPHSPKILNRVVYPAGRTIIEQGDKGTRAYYIEKGTVEVLVHDGNHQLKVSELKAGDIFGEMSLITHEERTATVKAVDAVTVTVIASDDIERKIERLEDKAIKALIRVLVDRLKSATKGQLDHYRNLTDFQDRVTGIVDQVGKGFDEKKRKDFRDEVSPLLDDLQAILDKYKR